LVDRAVQAHFHSQQPEENTLSDSLHQYSGTKLNSSLPSSLIVNNMSLLTMTTPRSPHHVITLTTQHGNLARKKAVFMLLLVTILYFIAFSPSQINFIYTQINPSHHLYEYRLFFLITILLALSSTAFNPILFYIFSKFFRCKFNILLRRVCSLCRASARQQNNFPMI
jgi:hypothetical protein